MFDFLDKLRQKPEGTKKRIAFFTALSVALIIFTVWLSVIYPDWREGESREANVNRLEPSPTSALSSTFSDGFSAIGDQFKKIKEALSSFSTSVEYYNSASSTQSTTTISE